MATIKDVAKRANLSVATVSRVLGNKDHVTEKTRKIVEDAVRELKYQPNVTARSLREKKTKSIIVVVPDIHNTFFPEVFRGIELVADQRDYRVWLEDAQNSVEVEKKIFEELPQKQVDGIISLTARTEKEVIETVAREYPLVIAGQYFQDSRIPHVVIDNCRASEDAVDHLIKNGHRRIAHVTGPLNQLIFRDRLKGYQKSLEKAGIAFDETLVFGGDYTYKSGCEIAADIVKTQRPLTAVFAANDEMAAGIIKGLKAAGKKVPEDYAVIGFDNIRLSSVVEPPVTTIDQPKLEMGIRAMEMLFDIIDGKKMEHKRVVLEHSLIVRESSENKCSM